ncbi:hypothetical protein BV22DRAFT_1144106 [Leucogyrophana mollusca]|uniref:Uncharacterized protein n=1 Tax=Leucogyrophana mollusca TaxID=85980 RepID=A0ACB8BU90_9AGAM|nr:hypothetical protein BV22DRAFT_1144106 [Leucogyrophana mollusca]
MVCLCPLEGLLALFLVMLVWLGGDHGFVKLCVEGVGCDQTPDLEVALARMDKFTSLEPTKLYSSSSAKPAPKPAAKSKPCIGRLPADLHLLVLSFLPVPDVPAYALCSRAAASVARDERIWERRWRALAVDEHGLAATLDAYDPPAATSPGVSDADDFGDFASAAVASLSFTDALPSKTFRSQYIRAHKILKPLLASISPAPHTTLAALFAQQPPSLRRQSSLLHLLALFLSPLVRPVRAADTLLAALNAAIDRFDVSLLTAFDAADSSGDERRMREASDASWRVWRGVGDWEMGKVWAEKREIFYELERWDPLLNFTRENTLSFDAMDAFMAHVLAALEEHGSRAVRVFPPAAGVLIAFADRVAVEVVGEYISALLTRARELSNEIFLKATAASFREAWRFVDVLVQLQEGDAAPDRTRSPSEKRNSALSLKGKDGALSPRGKDSVPDEREKQRQREKAEDVVYRMFEPNMDDYLDEEVESLKHALDAICKDWERSTSTHTPNPSTSSTHTQTRFLTAQNPALVKRTVLASFADVLLLPVTIVPRAVGGVGNAVAGAVGGAVGGVGSVAAGVGSAAVQGIAMLNPQRWVGGGGGGGYERGVGGGYERGAGAGQVEKYEDGEALFEIGEAEGEDADAGADEKLDASENADWGGTDEKAGGGADDKADAASRSSTTASVTPQSLATPQPQTQVAPQTQTQTHTQTQTLDLLLSLDVALSLIHADREALKRLETFAAYPGHYGRLVRDAIEEVFCLMLGAVGERHVRAGFGIATDRMTSYKPAEHASTASVAPLVQFFELVHIGDMIQSIVQVYFDKELAPHIDRTDFLNVVVREKKRFENTLDDCVAAGLNAGTQVLMNQVEHIILTLTKPREYYPPSDAPLELGPTHGCTEAIRCLEMHCKLLKGSTSKEVLEVFYTEVGIRLIGILQKHIKRQIISLNGGFQVIADLNAYYAFIASLKVPSITADFSHLKMLGHVFVVEDAKDLAQIVRDVTRYGGAYRPEDIYEFIQRRSDWKKIEKTVDKTMYNLSFKEDCVVC